LGYLDCINKFATLPTKHNGIDFLIEETQSTMSGLFSLRSKASDGLSGAPDFLGPNSIEFLLERLSIILSPAEFQSPLRLGTILHFIIEFIKHGLIS